MLRWCSNVFILLCYFGLLTLVWLHSFQTPCMTIPYNFHVNTHHRPCSPLPHPRSLPSLMGRSPPGASCVLLRRRRSQRLHLHPFTSPRTAPRSPLYPSHRHCRRMKPASRRHHHHLSFHRGPRPAAAKEARPATPAVAAAVRPQREVTVPATFLLMLATILSPRESLRHPPRPTRKKKPSSSFFQYCH